jgi:hypothetical protein
VFGGQENSARKFRARERQRRAREMEMKKKVVGLKESDK